MNAAPTVAAASGEAALARLDAESSFVLGRVLLLGSLGGVIVTALGLSLGGASEPRVAASLGALRFGLRHGEPWALVNLGILLILATPALRVACSAFIFARRGNRSLAGRALGVLALLGLGALLGVHG